MLAVTIWLCGCQSAPAPEPPKAAQAAPTHPILGDERMPTKEEEQQLFDHAADKLQREEKEANEIAEEERHLKHKVKALRRDADDQGAIMWSIKLGRFYRNHKRYKDAIGSFQTAYDLSSRIEQSDALYREAPAELADEYLRARQYDKAVPLYERAQTCTNNSPEMQARLLERLVWAYRGQGKTAKAQQTLDKAKDLALERCGGDSVVFRLALIEQAVLNLDAGKREEFDALKLKLAKMKLKGSDRIFAKPFLRVCAATCRKQDQQEQEDFLEEHVIDFTRENVAATL